MYNGGMLTDKQAIERWKIACEVLEEQYLEHAERTADIIESLQITISDLLRERNKRIDQKFDGKTNPQPIEKMPT